MATDEFEDSKIGVVMMDGDPPHHDDKKKPSCCTCDCSKDNIIKNLKENLLLILTAVGIVFGFIIGFVVRPYKPSPDALMWIGIPGDIFLRLLKMMIIPLVVSCIISGAASLDSRSNGKVSVMTLAYVMVTNATSTLIGIILSLTIRQGGYGEAAGIEKNGEEKQLMQTQDIFADMLRNLFPDNIIAACFRQTQTSYNSESKAILMPAVNVSAENVTSYFLSNGTAATAAANVSSLFTNETLIEYIRQIGFTDGSNMLGIIFCSLVFGIATSNSGEVGQPFFMFFNAASELIIKILGWFLWYSPIGIASLTAAAIAGIGNIEATFRQLGLFILAVVVGVTFQQLILVPAVEFITRRRNPFTLYVYNLKSWLTSFATTSVAVTIPDLYKGCEKYSIDIRVIRFVLPFCSATNKAGSAIFVTCSVLLIAQRNDMQPDAGGMFILWLMITILMCALPDIPSGSVVIVMIICQSIGLPVADVAMLFTVEWFLDRVRSTGNAMSTAYCASFVYFFCQKDLHVSEQVEQCTSHLRLGSSVKSLDNHHDFVAGGAGDHQHHRRKRTLSEMSSVSHQSHHSFVHPYHHSDNQSHDEAAVELLQLDKSNLKRNGDVPNIA
ncbi:excitatory amino acid transporter-like [Tubulanus polymorphus]|uniref:excitatory amino acid transporter-like n=1 Tax=Tubulanus polymorphus TaxID=672921 RepID=UPI003DA3A212